jgi:hypothetical protein
MTKIEITYVGNWEQPDRADGLQGSDFEVYDSGQPHPDAEWRHLTKLIAYRNGSPVNYRYEGNLDVLSGYTQEQIVALRDQLLKCFSFNPEKNLFT